jgi:glutamate/tyrosine decarboxylase-like PLP-dependent enzyme
MSLKQYGVKKYGRIIKKNINLARYFAALIEESEDFEISAPVNLNIVCFRYFTEDFQNQYPNQKGYIEDYLRKLNQEIIKSMRKDGRILLSSTNINNRFVLRMCIVNYRTRKKDIDEILKIFRELGIKADIKLRNKRD